MLGRSSLPVGEGLWLPGVASVHTFGVRFPLDLLFLDEGFICVGLMPRIPPGRLGAHGPGASHTLELAAGTLAAQVPGARMGDSWLLERLPDASC